MRVAASLPCCIYCDAARIPCVDSYYLLCQCFFDYLSLSYYDCVAQCSIYDFNWGKPQEFQPPGLHLPAPVPLNPRGTTFEEQRGPLARAVLPSPSRGGGAGGAGGGPVEGTTGGRGDVELGGGGRDMI